MGAEALLKFNPLRTRYAGVHPGFFRLRGLVTGARPGLAGLRGLVTGARPGLAGHRRLIGRIFFRHISLRLLNGARNPLNSGTGLVH